ncbi:MAG: hypothetical protein OXH63_04860 [Gemmatimonadetes bacterium]|nr:hypothetical protein [Gemmatimonadota bacterium]
MLKMHGFEVDAKRAFIDLLYNDEAHEEDKADALYQLGLIAFNNKDIGLATETWGILIDEFPNTEKGRTVSAEIKYLLEDYDALVLESAKEEIRNREEEMRDAQAQSYLLNAQFWWDPPKQWGVYTSPWFCVPLVVYKTVEVLELVRGCVSEVSISVLE